jgi:hypothetical protein
VKGVQLTQLEQFSVQQSVSHGQVEQVTRVPCAACHPMPVKAGKEDRLF